MANSIVKFFAYLWTSFVALFVSKEKMNDVSPDIESGIALPIICKAPPTDAVLDIKRDASILVPTADGLFEVDLTVGTVERGQPSRRPSRRASAVDPVKSRILETTMKQVQDKTIDVVKTVVVQPPSVIMVAACSATIEYYDPREHISEAHFGSVMPRPGKVEPPAAHKEVAQAPVFYPAPNEGKKPRRSHRRNSSSSLTSLSDLVSLFPLPPVNIPTPTPEILRRISENRKYAFPPPVSPVAYSAEEQSGDCSDTETITSVYSSGSTADTSLMSSPLSTNEYEGPACPGGKGKQRARSFAMSTEASSSACGGFGAKPAFSRTADTTTTVFSAGLGLGRIPSPGMVERSHKVVDGFKRADLQKGDIFDAVRQIESERSRIEAMLATSPSEDVLVDSLLAQMEASFELDPQEPDSPYGDIYSLGRKVEAVTEGQGVAPLRIIKKKREQPARVRIPPPAEPPMDAFLAEATAKWEAYRLRGIQAFKDAEAVEADFRDLFYGDSLYSQDSGAFGTSTALPSAESVSGGSYTSSLCDKLDDLLDSAAQSIVELSLASDSLSAAVEQHEESLISSSQSVAAIMRAVDVLGGDNTVSAPHPPRVEVQEVGVDSKADLPTWLPLHDDQDSDDSTETEGGGDDDQWSDIFELDSYAG